MKGDISDSFLIYVDGNSVNVFFLQVV